MFGADRAGGTQGGGHLAAIPESASLVSRNHDLLLSPAADAVPTILVRLPGQAKWTYFARRLCNVALRQTKSLRTLCFAAAAPRPEARLRDHFEPSTIPPYWQGGANVHPLLIARP